MTAAGDRQQLDPTAPLRPSGPYQQDRRPFRVAVLAVAFAVCELVGMMALVRSYHIAQTTLSSMPEFAWFYAGMLLLELPIVVLVARRATSGAMRTALITLYGLVSYAPKLLRNPSSPLYHDEFAHWRATYEVLSTGKLFQPDPLIPIISRYPGLHAAAAALVHVTGVSIWQAATILLILCHVTLVLGIAVLAQSLGLDNRTASVVAVLYGLNSSFLYFDTQYGYESIAITLVVWTLAAYVRAVRSQSRRGRIAWGALTAVFSASTVVVHHLSSVMLILIMILISLTLSVPGLAGGRASDGRRTAVTAWGLTLFAALVAGAWFRFVAPGTWTYLSPYLFQGFSELVNFARGAGPARQLFSASLLPWWEQKSAYLVPVFAFGLAAGGLLLARAKVRRGYLQRGRRRALLAAFAGLGLVYFPSTVFILAPAGAEGARRSWAFTWIGLCILAGPAVIWLLEWTRRRARRWARASLRSGLMVALAISVVGGTAAGLNPVYRFPGPFLFGSDARSITPELLGTSMWFSARFGPGHNIVTDRYTGLIMASFGLQNTATASAGFPTYNLYLSKPGSPIEPPFLLDELNISKYMYLIVDGRMANEVPALGVYFEADEPSFLTKAGTPAFSGRLSKFNTIAWMVKVYQSGDYSIYRLELPANQAAYQHQTSRLKGKLGKLSVTK